MIISMKVYDGDAMTVMRVLKDNGYKPVMSYLSESESDIYFDDPVRIAFDTNDVVNKEDECKDSTPVGKSDCPYFEECWEELDETTKEENDKAVEEFLNLLMRGMSESATKKSRILNE